MLRYKFSFLLNTTLFFCFVFSSNLFGQKNYIEGQIITLEGEVKKGLIDYQNWNRNPDKISFKSGKGGRQVDYFPKEIKGFKVADESYESAEVQIETSQIEGSLLTEDNTLKLANDTVFLQTIVKGEKSLFLLRNNEKELFYIEEREEYQLLKYKQYIKNKGGTNAIVDHKEYITQLNQYLKNCSSVIQKLAKVKYRAKDLKKIFLHYYDCTSSKYEILKKEEKVKYQFGPLIGLSMNSLSFQSSLSNFNFLTEADFSKNSIGIIAGLHGELIFARNRGKFSMYHEVAYANYNTNGYYENISSEDDYTTINTNFNYSYLNIILQPRYNVYSKNKTSVFVNGGVSAGFVLNQSNSKVTEKILFGTAVQRFEGAAISSPSNREYGIVSGVGIKFQRISAELRYQGRIGMLNLVSLSSWTHQFAFLVGYKL